MPWQDVCLSVRPSHAGTVTHILKVFYDRVAPPFWFFRTKRDGNIPTGMDLTGALNARGI